MPSSKKNGHPFINITSEKLLIKKTRSWNPRWKCRSSRSRNTARLKVRPLDVILVTFVNRVVSFTFTVAWTALTLARRWKCVPAMLPDVLAPVFADVVACALTAACFLAFASTVVVSLACWPHAVSAKARLPMHIGYRIPFIFPSIFRCRLDSLARAAIRQLWSKRQGKSNVIVTFRRDFDA